MDFADARWGELEGGYRVPYDPRAALRLLESGADDAKAWAELWGELHHQGDLGDASYAAVPELVRIHCARGSRDWNTYALIGTIELQRSERDNPPIPDWLESDYASAWRQLGELAIGELAAVSDDTSVRSILGVLALAKGKRVIGKLVLELTEDELREMCERYLGS
jgi:hypothetical protein